MRKIILFTIGIFLTITTTGQVQLTQYFLDASYYNPAVAGSNDAICTNVFARQQWLGLEDPQANAVSPFSVVYNVHAPVYSLKSGIGAVIIYDKLGFEKNLGVKLNYAYRLSFNDEKNKLGIGIGFSLLNKTISFDKLILEEPGDPLLKIDQQESGLFTDLDFGLFYQQGRKLYIGLSGINLLGSTKGIGNISYSQSRNFYFTSCYRIALLDSRRESLYFVPSILIKSNLDNAQIDLNGIVEYNNLYWGGFSWRYQDAVAVMAGLNHKGFRFGASYDLTTGSLADASSGSIEVFLGYCHPITPKVKLNSLYNTRYL